MDFRHLRTFVTVVEQGTVSKAALHLRIAQPALSRHISDLEQELGLKLFDRIAHRLQLTGEGAQLLGNCRRLLGDVSSLREQAQQLRGGDVGVITAAAHPVHIETVLSEFLSEYTQRYPNVQVKLIEAGGADSLGMLDRGEIQLGIAAIQSEQLDERVGYYAVPPSELLAVCHPKFQADRRGTIEIARLVRYPLLLLDSGHSASRKTFDAACYLAGLKPTILIESKAPHALLALAEAGLGVAILPSAVRTHAYKLRIVRITFQGKALLIPLAIVWDKRRVLPRFAEYFRDLLAEHMRKPLNRRQSIPEVERATKRRGRA
jgi:DNA-binding transcriptional LysR family regulator